MMDPGAMGELLKFLANAAALVVIVAAGVFLVFMERITVPSNAMAPTLVYGDEVLVWKHPKVDRTDVLVCPHPVRAGEWIVGRAVAFAGESLRTDHNGVLYLNNDPTAGSGGATVHFYDAVVRRPYRMRRSTIEYFVEYSHDVFVEEGRRLQLEPHTVQRGVFLLGDNRALPEFDSRELGDLDPETCLGQVVLRWKPGPQLGDDLGHRALDFIH